ncbi:hypothetical protein H5410_057859 [Solanum commersonii]|uniref:Uncharacterized protein n=1 Tax=Solanum commersonii TaxID=4109 RepID=A0A9J5WQY4_SOLCO|nr:hypothetical protein H5410_057859 [Solanum commersonii]
MLYPKKKIVRTCVFKVAADSNFSIFTYASVRSSIEVCSEVIVSFNFHLYFSAFEYRMFHFGCMGIGSCKLQNKGSDFREVD